MKNPEMLKFVPDHLKTKKICKNAVKKLAFLLRYVSNRYKTSNKFLSNKDFLINVRLLENGEH